METKTLRLTLDVTYNPNGVSDSVLRGFMHDIAGQAAMQGLMTGESAAEVEDWNAKVEEVQNPG